MKERHNGSAVGICLGATAPQAFGGLTGRHIRNRVQMTRDSRFSKKKKKQKSAHQPIALFQAPFNFHRFTIEYTHKQCKNQTKHNLSGCSVYSAHSRSLEGTTRILTYTFRGKCPLHLRVFSPFTRDCCRLSNIPLRLQ